MVCKVNVRRERDRTIGACTKALRYNLQQFFAVSFVFGHRAAVKEQVFFERGGLLLSFPALLAGCSFLDSCAAAAAAATTFFRSVASTTTSCRCTSFAAFAAFAAATAAAAFRCRSFCCFCGSHCCRACLVAVLFVCLSGDRSHLLLVGTGEDRIVHSHSTDHFDFTNSFTIIRVCIKPFGHHPEERCVPTLLLPAPFELYVAIPFQLCPIQSQFEVEHPPFCFNRRR